MKNLLATAIVLCSGEIINIEYLSVPMHVLIFCRGRFFWDPPEANQTDLWYFCTTRANYGPQKLLLVDFHHKAFDAKKAPQHSAGQK